MNNQNFVRGLFLAAISLLFGVNAIRYNVGTLGHAGPGMFPAMVSGMLLVIAVITMARTRYVPRVPLGFNYRNIGLLLSALCAFALVSKFVNMTAGIATMVFIAAFAGRSSYSVVRNLKIAGGLIAVAFAFQKLLGLSLPLL
jgi:hypothetical protein